MEKANQTMDEYTLAAFMAGTLPRSRRAEVAEYLSNNADARELLQMAYEALESSHAQEDDDALHALPFEERPASRNPIPRADRRPALSRRRASSIGRFVAAAVMVFAVGAGLRLSLGPPADALRSRSSAEALELSIRASEYGPVFLWSPLENAYQYRVVVWDPEEAVVMGRLETKANRVDAKDDFIRNLRDLAEQGRQYTVRVDALDARNRLLDSSVTLSTRFVE